MLLLHSVVQSFTHTSINVGRFSVASDENIILRTIMLPAECKFK